MAKVQLTGNLFQMKMILRIRPVRVIADTDELPLNSRTSEQSLNLSELHRVILRVK